MLMLKVDDIRQKRLDATWFFEALPKNGRPAERFHSPDREG